MREIQVTQPMVFKAVNANCALRPDGLSSYSAHSNFESSYMPKALAAYFLLQAGHSGPAVKREVASSEKDWEEITNMINHRADAEEEHRWNIKKKLISKHIALRLEREAELQLKHKG